MKKELQILILMGCLSLFYGINISSQELLSGGNMEDISAWQASQLDGQVTTTATFNYTTDTPANGVGGCAHFTATTEANTDHKYAQYCIYQKVTLEVGKTYTVKGAYKAIKVANFWCEVRISDMEPEDGSDYKPYGEDPFINLSTWDGLKNGDDSTFNKDYTVPDTYGSPGDEIDMYFVIKMGVWDYTIVYEFLLDEISLTPEGASGIFDKEKVQLVNVYPNPTADMLNINTVELKPNSTVEILNVLGQTVFKRNLTSKAIDVSNLSNGIYTIVISDNNTKYTSKFIKK